MSYVTLEIGDEDDPEFTIGFTVTEALEVVESINDAITQALASQKALVN